MELPQVNKMLVIIPTDKHPEKQYHGKQFVFYVSSEKIKNDLRLLIQVGYYRTRSATQLEKELCYWHYEKRNLEGVSLDALPRWIEYKHKLFAH